MSAMTMNEAICEVLFTNSDDWDKHALGAALGLPFNWQCGTDHFEELRNGARTLLLLKLNNVDRIEERFVELEDGLKEKFIRIEERMNCTGNE